MGTPQEDSEEYARENYDPETNSNHPDHPNYNYTGPESYPDGYDPDRSDTDTSNVDQDESDHSSSGFGGTDETPYQEEVGEINKTDDYSKTIKQKEIDEPTHSGFRDAEQRSKKRNQEPTHSGFRKAESNPINEFFREPLPTQEPTHSGFRDTHRSEDYVKPAPAPTPAKLDIIGDGKDENWYTPFPSAYADSEPTPESTNNNNSNPRTKRSRTHDSNTVYLNKNKQPVSVAGVPLEAKNQTEQKTTWNQRGHRAGQMIGLTPSTGSKNSVTEFVEGLAAPVQNIAQGVEEFTPAVSNYLQGKGFSISQHEYEKWTRNEEPQEYKETLVDNLISGKEPTRSPSYYAGTALTDVGLFVAPVPIGKIGVATKFSYQASKNLKKAQRIAKVTQEDDIIQDVGQASRYTTKEGKNTKVIDPAVTRIRQDIFLKRINRATFKNLSAKDKKIAVAEFKKIAEFKKAKEAKEVKQITPDHYIISRGTESKTADFPATLIDYSKGGKVRNVKSKINDKKSPDKADIRGDVDDTTKEILGLFEKNKRQYVSKETLGADQNFMLRQAENKGHIKSWTDVDVYHTKDAQYLADSSLGFGKVGKEIPITKTDPGLERIYQTLMAKHSPKGKTGDVEIGDKNFDKFLTEKGLTPPKQSKKSTGSSSKSTGKSWADSYKEQYVESKMTHVRAAEEIEKLFETSAKASFKKSKDVTKAKVDKASKVSTGFAFAVDTVFGKMPPALDNSLDYTVSTKEASATKLDLDASLGQGSLQGFGVDSIAEQGQKLFQDAVTDKKTPQKTIQTQKSNTKQKIIPDVIPIIGQEHLELTGIKTAQKTDSGLTTFVPPITTNPPPEIIIPEKFPPPFPIPDFFPGGIPRYGYDLAKAGRAIHFQSGVKDTPFETHNITDFEYSYKEIADKPKKKGKKSKKSTGKKKPKSKKSTGKKKQWWEV